MAGAGSRSSGGGHGSPSARVHLVLVGRVRQRAERGDILRPIRSPARAPSRSRRGGATTSSTGTPSRRHADVRPEHRHDLRQRREARALTASGSPSRRRPRAGSAGPTQRRTSPAAMPPSAAATARRAPAPGRAGAGRGGAARRARARRAIRASVCGPIAGHLAQPARRRGRARSSATVRIPSAGADLRRAGWAPRPSIRPNAASSGEIVCRSSSSSAMRARLDELAHAPLDPRPDAAQLPRTSGPDELGDRERRRPDQLGRRAGTRAPHSRSRPESSSSAAYSSSAAAISSFEGWRGTAPMWGLSPMSPGLASSRLVDRLLRDLRQLLVGRRLLVERLAEQRRGVGVARAAGPATARSRRRRSRSAPPAGPRRSAPRRARCRRPRPPRPRCPR